MGQLIVIEGLDGAGKRTLADGLAAELGQRGQSVSRTAFPRYSDDMHADLVAEALRGAHGDLAESVYGMAVLYALDRYYGKEALRSDLAAHDVVLVDRYVASNAAYGAARLHQGVGGDFPHWVHDLELERFALPRPDLHLLLQVPTQLAADRTEHRERSESDRRRDHFEADASLQQRCAHVYAELADEAWWSPWLVVDGVERVDFPSLAEAIVRH